MVQIRRTVSVIVLAGALLQSGAGVQEPKFFPDDPIQAMPVPLPVTRAVRRDIDPVLDFLDQRRISESPAVPADGVNTLGEVPDSEWFTNRHARVRLTREELQQRGKFIAPPLPPFKVISGKDEGITPGFAMEDSKGRHYFVKGDPVDYPELTTSSEAIVSRLLYAVGYNTPRNDIVVLKLSELSVSHKARMRLPGGRSRPMAWSDVTQIVKQFAQRPDGAFRVVASLAIEGEGIGPFQYEDTRSDDPNDTIPHQDRRDLRGLYVLFAWLNNTDAKAGNGLDTIVEENGVRFIRHYLLDFGSALGSDGDSPKDARYGNEFMIGTAPSALKKILSLGLTPAEWEQTRFPNLTGIGRFESQSFDPDRWHPDYPNPAFIRRLPDDDFWAAKQVMAFTDADIRAVVQTAAFSDPRSTEYMITTLAERRNKIGRTFFSKILPLDRFRVQDDTLLFDDLAVTYGFHDPRQYAVQWSAFDNISRRRAPIPAGNSAHLPSAVRDASSGAYFCATIDSPGGSLKPVSIYLRKEKSDYQVVGIDR